MVGLRCLPSRPGSRSMAGGDSVEARRTRDGPTGGDLAALQRAHYRARTFNPFTDHYQRHLKLQLASEVVSRTAYPI